MTNHFEPLRQPLAEAVNSAFTITEPTDIQEQAIPRILDGHHVILGSPTGSGKTLAYLLPLLSRIDQTQKAPQLLIVAPTQELAVQIAHVLRDLNDALAEPYPYALLAGGANIRYQLEKLKNKPPVLIGTPGRVLELFGMRRINGQTIRAAVFDEIDAICEHDSGEAYRAIKKALLKDCQTIAASASMDAATRTLLSRSLPDADWLGEGGTSALNPNIDHLVLSCEGRKKFDRLRQALAAFDGQILIFLNGEDDIRRLKERLAYHHIEADTLYADMKKSDRAETLKHFRAGLSTLLIASDLGARGLDVPGIGLVLNMDFPRDPQTYVHRAGRTARGTAHGLALSFAAPQDEAALRIYARDLGITFREVHFAEGALMDGPPPRKDTAKTATRSKPGKHSKKKGMPRRLRETDSRETAPHESKKEKHASPRPVREKNSTARHPSSSDSPHPDKHSRTAGSDAKKRAASPRSSHHKPSRKHAAPVKEPRS